MAIDARALKPVDLVRLLNSTPLGPVLSAPLLSKHRARAGLRIGEFRKVDLFRYAAWLFDRHRQPKANLAESAKAAGKKRADYLQRLSLAGRDIGALHAVENPARKARASGDFQFYCEAYFKKTFSLAWSPDHLAAIAKIQKAVTEGGLFALAMPRGSGKSSLAEVACLWATMNGHQNFVALIGASEAHAQDMLESMKSSLSDNPLLDADYPEVCSPIRALDGIANRCAGQLYTDPKTKKAARTHIGWTAVDVALPTMPGSRASGAIIKVAGLTGRIRGMKYKRHDGRMVRPGLVVIDDPQNDESARSLSQCITRMSLICGTVLGLGEPGKKIAVVMPCTVIQPGDVADQVTDRQKHPEWNGTRSKMVYKFPTNEKLWEKYATIRGDSLRAYGDIRLATDFYLANRGAMDEGAEVAWPERFNHDEASAVQHAMNLKLQNEDAFLAEYQNEPKSRIEEEGVQLTPDQVTLKVNGTKRGIVGLGASHLTAFIDVQGKLLYWVVCGWEDDFTGTVVDYGAYPDQRRPYFTLREAQRTLQTMAKGAGLEGAIYTGLGELTKQLLGKAWVREDGAEIRVGLCMIDANWGASTDTVYQFCRQSDHAAQLLPSHGRYVGAASRPFSDYERKPGDRVGLNWRIPRVKGKRVSRYALYDTNFWKSFIAGRLGVSLGDRGSLSLFGKEPTTHQLLADHLTAEYCVRTEGRDRTVDEWKWRPDKRDNHWLDGLTGCAVAASIMGATLPGTQAEAIRPRRVVKLSEVKARRGR